MFFFFGTIVVVLYDLCWSLELFWMFSVKKGFVLFSLLWKVILWHGCKGSGFFDSTQLYRHYQQTRKKRRKRGEKNKSFSFELWFLIVIQLYPFNETWKKTIKVVKERKTRASFLTILAQLKSRRMGNTICMGKPRKCAQKTHTKFTYFLQFSQKKKNTSNFFDCAGMIYFSFHARYISLSLSLKRRVNNSVAERDEK